MSMASGSTALYGARSLRLGRHQLAPATWAASRGGDFDALLAVLDPDVDILADPERLSQLDLTILDG
jgi:hypothetical protein